jgi:hypothetical protein
VGVVHADQAGYLAKGLAGVGVVPVEEVHTAYHQILALDYRRDVHLAAVGEARSHTVVTQFGAIPNELEAAVAQWRVIPYFGREPRQAIFAERINTRAEGWGVSKAHDVGNEG